MDATLESFTVRPNNHAILGVTNNDDSSACLIINGKIIAAVQEERFSRIKGHKGWPHKSIEHVLKAANMSIDEVTDLAYGWSAGFNPELHLNLYTERLREVDSDDTVTWNCINDRIHNEIKNDKSARSEFVDFANTSGFNGSTHMLDHHETHALGAYICSGFDDALVVTCDGRGDFQSLTVTDYTQLNARVLQRETSTDSLGYFYGRITKLLGYLPNRHEGKVTGLAAKGNPETCMPLMQKMISLENGRLRANCGPWFQPYYDQFSEELRLEVAKYRPEDIAAAAQKHLEDLITAIVSNHIAADRPRNVCLAGGVFGNVKLNQRIRELPGVNTVYVLPCMGDGGLALAAAVAASAKKYRTSPDLDTMALGPDHDDTDAIGGELSRDGLRVYGANIQDEMIDLIGQSKIIGVVRGALEYGPRALCKRSIIFHARDKSINDWLNKRLNRTEFMPFAPITPENLAHLCYNQWSVDDRSAHSMTMTYNCTDLMKEMCPAVVHVDGTARPQIISEKADPFLYELLNKWFQLTGEPSLINTSYNRHEEPIINTPQEAATTVHDGIVEALFINDQLVVKKK